MQAAGRVPRGALRDLLGGKIASCHCGGAALARETYDFYWENEIPIFPGYGLTESSPVVSVSNREHLHPDAVGSPIQGVDVEIASDGEILTRGPHVMMGYLHDEQKTREALRGGWLHTGDLGEIGTDGLLRITGRKKELIVTSAGRKFIPTGLEELLTADPLIMQAIVVGDGREYLVALIVPDPERLADELAVHGVRPTTESNRQFLSDPRALALFRERIDQRLARLSHHEQIRAFCLLPLPFTPESGHLTPKHTLRRAVIARDFAEQIDGLYRSSPNHLDT
jgi:long-chain acyl-CoA synthetase